MLADIYPLAKTIAELHLFQQLFLLITEAVVLLRVCSLQQNVLFASWVPIVHFFDSSCLVFLFLESEDKNAISLTVYIIMGPANQYSYSRKI